MTNVNDAPISYVGALAIPSATPVFKLTEVFTALSDAGFSHVPAGEALDKWSANRSPLSDPSFCKPMSLLFFEWKGIAGYNASDSQALLETRIGNVLALPQVKACQVRYEDGTSYYAGKPGAHLDPRKPYVKPTVLML